MCLANARVEASVFGARRCARLTSLVAFSYGTRAGTHLSVGWQACRADLKILRLWASREFVCVMFIARSRVSGIGGGAPVGCSVQVRAAVALRLEWASGRPDV